MKASVYLTETREMTWGNTPEEVEAFLDAFRMALKDKFPYSRVTAFDSSYKSLFVDVAFNPKDEWTYNIWHNSHYFSFSLYNPTGKVTILSNGSLKMTEEYRQKHPYHALVGMQEVCGKFRAFTMKNDKDGKKTIKKIVDYLEGAYRNYKLYLKELEKEGKL